MCSICGSEEIKKTGKSHKEEDISLCENCCLCEECCEEVEEILPDSWKLKVYVIRPADWIFLDPSTFEKEEDYCLLCNCCRQFFCDTCKSMDCKERCDTCDAPCSEDCGH